MLERARLAALRHADPFRGVDRRRGGRRGDAAVGQAREHLVRAMRAIPAQIGEILAGHEAIREIATKYAHHSNFLYLGRGYNFPVALEGALKLKEISYVHAEGYPAGEMKHGPIALIEPGLPIVAVANEGPLYEKVVSNIQEVRAREGYVIAIATEGDEQIKHFADEVIYIPKVDPILIPLVATVPMQLLSYHVAHLRGTDIDQPRNLAKSVTVE